ncbi:MAG: DUF4097 family beta strand repeat-containing protein [Vicinamibacterales bacterium]
MGKRELLLVAAFIVLGTVVYQVTATPVDPSRPGWSFSGMVQQLRRHLGGNQATAKTATSTTAPAPSSLREMRIVMRSGAITVTGEDRTDIQIDLKVSSTGFDAAEAEQLAKATTVKVDEAGPLLIATVDYPEAGRQTASLEVRVPKRLVIRMDEKNGVLTVNDVAGVVIGAGRGESNIANIAGLVQVTQRGSVISVSDVDTLRLTTRSGAEARVVRVRGDASFTLQGGELRAEAIVGAIEVDGQNTDVRFEKLEKTGRPLRINVNNGEVVLAGVQTETRIDGRDTDIRVDQPVAALLSIYNDGDEAIEFTAPANGFNLDAITAEGRLTIDSGLEKAGVSVSEGTKAAGDGSRAARNESRASAAVRGGGPTITIRATRGDITIRSR